MADQDQAEALNSLISAAKSIVVVQGDNPDTDSLASSLALEHILGDMGKQVTMFCGVELPSYLRYLAGADRVVSQMPTNFDLSLIVDTSSQALLEQLGKSGALNWLAAKPAAIIDHHATPATISFATVIYNRPAVATAEVIYELAGQFKWPLNLEAKKMLAIGILSDSLGLTTNSTSARSIHIIGELVEAGVSLAEIDNARRETLRREPELIHYKGRLLERVEFHDDGRLALLTIPWEEIEKYSPLYNPPMLVIDDMRLAKKTDLAVCFKLYRDGKITAKIRANYGKGIADKLAEHFGGGGHPYASGFKLQDGRPYAEVKQELIETVHKLLDELEAAKA
jgi:bifunctional oligoribonuclease and PAP phosphatase NrnA